MKVSTGKVYLIVLPKERKKETMDSQAGCFFFLVLINLVMFLYQSFLPDLCGPSVQPQAALWKGRHDFTTQIFHSQKCKQVCMLFLLSAAWLSPSEGLKSVRLEELVGWGGGKKKTTQKVKEVGKEKTADICSCIWETQNFCITPNILHFFQPPDAAAMQILLLDSSSRHFLLLQIRTMALSSVSHRCQSAE